MNTVPRDGSYASKYPQVIFEEAENEVIVVDLLNGVYYFLTGTAAYIWMALHAGLTPHQIGDEVARTGASEDVVNEDVGKFVQELISLHLIAASDNTAMEISTIPSRDDYLVGGYTPPSIETYSDLQDILLLDPVHEVDEAGWPQPKTD